MQPKKSRLKRLYPALLFIALLSTGCGGSESSPTATPVISPASGTYTHIPTLTIEDATPGASFHYTTDGTTPTASSNLYSPNTPLTVPQTETVNVIAVAGNSTSAVASASYTINLPPATPVLSPAPGVYRSAQTIIITDSTPGASIYYTTDGSSPTASSTPYTAPVTVTASEILNAVAVSQGSGSSFSAVGGGSFSILLPPVLSEAGGAYTSAQTLTITEPSAPGALIYYTTNGSLPNPTTSTQYTGPITVPATETITAVAVATPVGGGTVTGPSVSQTYLIHLPGASFVQSGTSASGSPIVGASVQLYAVGATGYGSAATPLLASPLTTDATGSFNLSGQYTCTPGTYLYLTASGGAVSPSTTANPNLTLAAALGSCSNLGATSSLQINEETTVAAAFALAQFASGSTFGHTQSNQQGSATSAPADNFATSSTNIAGLANAMAISQVLVGNITGSSPGGNSNGGAVPEWWQVNLIADMLSACVRSPGGSAGDGSTCGTLFANALNNGTAPADTLQAALDLALHPTTPSANIVSLLSLVSLSSPFQPYPLSAASITDFSIGIEYQPLAGTTALLSQPSGIAIDSLGNAWVGNQPTTGTGLAPYQGYLVELTPTGLPIQAGATNGSSSSNYVINSYSLGGVSVPFGGQYGLHNSSYQLVGLLLPAIDANNNVWIQDRQNSVMTFISGSGTTYSKSLTYQNGGNALDSGGNGAIGHSLNAASYPASTAIDGSGSVWFQMVGTIASGSCSALGSQNYGLGGFVAGSSSNAVYSMMQNVTNFSQPLFITIDPNINDTIKSGGTTTEIPGAPFVWTLASNGNTLLSQNYSKPTSGIGITGQPCYTPVSYMTVGPDTVAGSTDTTTAVHGITNIPDIPNPALLGDYLHYSAEVNLGAGDQTWDKFGNLWIANQGQINTSTASPIKASITRLTPNYGSSFTPAQAAANFSFKTIHGVAGLYDNATDYPSYLTTDGAGNVWFSLLSNSYVNAITNVGTALSPYMSGVTSTTAGFAGSVCSGCSVNGVKATYSRPNGLAINRPAIDLSGNVWLPVSGIGSNYVDVLVGIAVPKMSPDSLGLKNNTFASQP